MNLNIQPRHLLTFRRWIIKKLFLLEERTRLNLKGKEVAAFTGITAQTQSNYELGKRVPDAQYLSMLVDLGFDIHYVLTGNRENAVLTAQEKTLLTLYQQSPKDVQDHILGGLQNSNDPSLLIAP